MAREAIQAAVRRIVSLRAERLVAGSVETVDIGLCLRHDPERWKVAFRRDHTEWKRTRDE